MDEKQNGPENRAAQPNNVKNVFDYECMMYREMSRLLNCDIFKNPSPLKNAIVESLLLHTRILVNILLSGEKSDDDITLEMVYPNISSHDKTKNDIDGLKEAYNYESPTEPSPRKTLNKMFAHPTTHRSDHYDYTSILVKITPSINSILEKIRKYDTPQSNG